MRAVVVLRTAYGITLPTGNVEATSRFRCVVGIPYGAMAGQRAGAFSVWRVTHPKRHLDCHCRQPRTVWLMTLLLDVAVMLRRKVLPAADTFTIRAPSQQ